MLVTINPDYKGTYGHFVEELGSVALKKAGCEPFEENDYIARKQIKNGVMVAVNPATVPVEPAEPVKTEPVEETESMEPEGKSVNWEDMSMAELRAAAKARGISSFGAKKATLIEALKEYEDTPELGAIDPV